METVTRTTLFKTVHGSRLYGLAHTDSDEDFYTVVTKKPVPSGRQVKARYAKQKITDDEDSMVVDFGTWVEMCKSGVPQALEAMFSDMVIGDDRIKDFRAGFRVGTGVYDRYMRTIKSFALSENDPFKRKRHALRLACNLREMRETGRFNPTLSIVEARAVTTLAERCGGEQAYELAKIIAWQNKPV